MATEPQVDTSPEVIIVGGGPAGASLAGLLALRGRRALVVEREAFPRFQIGESLLPQSMTVFEELGIQHELEARFMRKYGARFVDGASGKMVRYDFSDALDKRYPYAFQVRRDEFDTLLLDRARELGAEVLQPCRVTDMLFEGERAVGVRVKDDGGSRELRAPLTVDATGRGALVASRNKTKARIDGLNMAALFAHFHGVPRYEGDAEGDITIVTFEHGWLWLIPFRGDTSSVGLVVTRDYLHTRRTDESYTAFFERTLRSVPWAWERMRDAKPTMPIRTAADFSYSVGQMAGPGWLCIGDATGFIDPLFSSGVHLALLGAKLASVAIDEALSDDDVSPERFAAVREGVNVASDTFLGIVQGSYSGRLHNYLFAQNQRKVLRQAITSLLSGDVLHDPVPAWARFMRGHFPAHR